MILVNNLRNGVIFLRNEIPYHVIKFEHIKMARGGAVIKLKVKEITSGVIKELAYNNGDKVEEADVYNKNMQYLYSDSTDAFFMDLADFSQISIPLENISNESKYFVEGKEYQVRFFGEKPLDVILPLSVFLKVAEAPDAVKGNTATNPTKTVILENGLKMQAPVFIKKGDTLKINTSTGEYTSRA
jgi:elongation factor P